MREVVIVDSVRTGLAKSFRGKFNMTRPDDMAAHCVDALLVRHGIDPKLVDDCNRPDTTLESLAKLQPAFDPAGSVTAGNASQLSDGASMTLVMSLEKALELGLKPKAYFRGFTVAGCEPDEMGIGPVFSVPKLLKAKGLSVADIDLWELNEAFASQCLYCRDTLEIDNEKYNVNGGSISIGHPFGMTGSRQVGHLVRELQRRELRYGIVTMCVGGGMGATGLFEAYCG
nr:acetyl-CoA C-acyltransferase [Pseudomonas sp. s4]